MTQLSEATSFDSGILSLIPVLAASLAVFLLISGVVSIG